VTVVTTAAELFLRMALSEVHNLAAIIGSNAFAVGKVRGRSLSHPSSIRKIGGGGDFPRILSPTIRWRYAADVSFYPAAPRRTLYTRNDISMHIHSGVTVGQGRGGGGEDCMEARLERTDPSRRTFDKEGERVRFAFVCWPLP